MPAEYFFFYVDYIVHDTQMFTDLIIVTAVRAIQIIQYSYKCAKNKKNYKILQ